MSGRRYLGQRFRGNTNLIRMAEQLRHAVDDVAQVSSADGLESDRQLLNSMAMEMLQAQGSARRLSDEYVASMPKVPWRELRGLHNIIVRQYDEIEVETLYESVAVDAKRLLELLRPYLENIKDG